MVKVSVGQGLHNGCPDPTILIGKQLVVLALVGSTELDKPKHLCDLCDEEPTPQGLSRGGSITQALTCVFGPAVEGPSAGL